MAPADAAAFCLLSVVSQSYANKPCKKMNYLNQAILERISPEIVYQPASHLKDVLYLHKCSNCVFPSICVFYVICL